MLEKFKKYRDEHKDVVYCGGAALFTAGCLVVVAKLVAYSNTPVKIRVKWATPDKTALRIRVAQRNGKFNYGLVSIPTVD